MQILALIRKFFKSQNHFGYPLVSYKKSSVKRGFTVATTSNKQLNRKYDKLLMYILKRLNNTRIV